MALLSHCLSLILVITIHSKDGHRPYFNLPPACDLDFTSKGRVAHKADFLSNLTR